MTQLKMEVGYTLSLSLSLSPSLSLALSFFLFLSLSLFLLILLLEFVPQNWLREDTKQKAWEKAARAFLCNNGVSREDGSAVTKLTEHRWRLTARSERAQQEALAEACDARDKNIYMIVVNSDAPSTRP